MSGVIDKCIAKVSAHRSEALVMAMLEMFEILSAKAGKESGFYYDKVNKELRFKGPQKEFDGIGLHVSPRRQSSYE